jgi:hypothetical protein
MALAGGRQCWSTGWVLSVTPTLLLGHWRAPPLRHGRGAARAVLSCAGAYVSGVAGSNECPAGSVRIETEAACRTAATPAGKTFYIVETAPAYPRGCYHFTNGIYAWFNTHAVGAGNSNTRLLCAAGTTTGALSPCRRRTDACSACTGARACRHRACAALHSRAVCVIPGAHIDARTYTNGYLYTHINIPV